MKVRAGKDGLVTLASHYGCSDAPGPRLRIGLLLNNTTLIRPFAAVVEHILQSNFAVIDLVVMNAGSQTGAASEFRRSLPARMWKILRTPALRKTLSYALYEKWDQRRFPSETAFQAEMDCSALLAGIDCIEVAPLVKGFVDRFPPEALETIKRRSLDVLLRFGFNILRGEILTAAKYGVWSYHHDDNNCYRGGPPGFWEIYEDNPLSGVILQVLNEELDAGQVLCKALVGTERGISCVRNRVQPYQTGTTFVIRKLHELHQQGWEHVCRNMLPQAPYVGRKKLYRKPTNREMCTFFIPGLVRRTARSLQKRSLYHWRIALRSGGHAAVGLESSADMAGFQWVNEPKGHFYADPFLIRQDGKTWMFFEDYLYAEKKGSISCAEVLPQAGIAAVRKVIEEPYHLSYPFVFRDAGEIFMIPESHKNRTVDLYRATRFPDEWRKQATLFRGIALDTTVWAADGVYWFFVTLIDPPGAGPQLFLFYADSLTGEWTWHPSNPICTDARYSRGAGCIFRSADKLLRPSQDCSLRYGYAIHFQEITELSRSAYSERPLGSISPSWSKGLDGNHTYNQCEEIEVIDGQFWSPMAAHTA